jgi:uncharacterized protein involved in outer membrane biogenesis
MRKLGIGVLILVVLLVAAALLVPRLIDVNRYHNLIQAELEKQLGRQVSLGEIGLSLFPPSLNAKNAVIADAPGFGEGQQPFATIEQLSFSMRFWPLLHHEVDIESLQLERPRIELIRNKEGIWNFASLGQPQTPAATPPAQSQPSAPAPSKEPGATSQQPGQFTLAQLVIHDGQLAVTDQQNREPRSVYDHIDLDLNDFAPDKPFSIRASVQLPGRGKQLVSLQGKGGPVQQSNLVSTPFDGQLRLEQVAVASARQFLKAQALSEVEGVLSGQADVKNGSGKIVSNGTLRLENAHIRNLDVGYPIALDYNVAGDLSNEVIQIHKADIKLGPTPLTITGTINGQPTPAQLDLHVTTTNASISELARLASAFGVAFGSETKVSGQVNANLQARGAANQPSLNGQLSGRNLEISSKQISQTVRVPAVDLALTPETIRSNDFTATAGSTNVSGNFVLTQYSTPNSSIVASVRAPNARISELLNIAKAAGISAVEGVSGDGTVALDVKAQGPTKNLSSFVFNGTGKIQNASLKLPSLAQPVQIHNSDVRFNQNSAALDNLSAAVGQTSVSGSLAVKDFAAPEVTAALRIPNARISELLDIAKAAKITAVEGVSGDGTLTLDIQAHGPTKNPSALVFNGTGKIQNASLKLPTLTQPVQIHNSDLHFGQNSATLENASVAIGQTNATGSLTVKDFAAPQITAALRVPSARISELLEIAKAAKISAVEGMSGDGSLTLDLQAHGPTKNLSALVINGTGKIQNASLKLASLSQPLQIHNSDIRFSQNTATLENVSAAVGQTTASGSLTLKDFAAPHVQFTLNADKVNVREFQQIFGAKPASTAPAARERDFWRIIPQAQAQTGSQQPANAGPSLLSKMTGAGTVSIGSIQYDDLVMTNAKSNVTIDHGLITMNPVTADLYGGKQNGNIVLDMRGAQPAYTVNLKTDHVDANKLLSSVSSVKEALYGLLASSVNARFSATSADDIARNLNGKMAINLTNGKLMNVDLLHELAAVGQFVGNLSAPKDFTNIVQLSGTFDVENGVAHTADLKATVDFGTMAGTGSVNLADQSLHLRVTAVLNRELSQRVGGDQIGGYLNTALANNQGELVLPVTVTGTFQHPKVAPDFQQMAQLKLQNILPNSKNLGGLLKNGPRGGIGGVLDQLGGKNQQQTGNEGADKNQGQQPQNNQGQQKPNSQGQQKQNPVGNILNQVLGNKNKPTPSPTPTPPQ